MRAIDLFCGAGGSSVGLKRAGFSELIGVDVNPQPEYPFEFRESDVFQLDGDFIKDFDFVWASPPCQAYSIGPVRFRKNGKDYPDLIGKTRKLLSDLALPFIIENVPGAPIRTDLSLIGPMFGLRVIRRRNFEIHGFYASQPPTPHYEGSVITGEYVMVVTGGNPGCFGKRDELKALYGQRWRENQKLEIWQEAMGIDWITDRKMLAEAIPPAYSEYIAREFFNQKTLTAFAFYRGNAKENQER